MEFTDTCSAFLCCGEFSSCKERRRCRCPGVPGKSHHSLRSHIFDYRIRWTNNRTRDIQPCDRQEDYSIYNQSLSAIIASTYLRPSLPTPSPPWPAKAPAVKTIGQIRTVAAGCRACDLWKNATETVFGEGPSPAKIMFVGSSQAIRGACWASVCRAGRKTSGGWLRGRRY